LRPQAAIPDFGRIAIEHPCDRPRRRLPGRDLDNGLAQPGLDGAVAHEALAPSCGLNPGASILAIEFRKHAGSLRPSHTCLDLRYRRLSARQDDRVLGDGDPERLGQPKENRRPACERAV
jgi:hypothetical protein